MNFYEKKLKKGKDLQECEVLIEMDRIKLFIENFVIYGLGGIIGKMIPFFILPIITRLLPDSYYMGISDLSNTLISFAEAIVVLGMYDAMFRMFFERKEINYQQEICSSALIVVLISSVIISLLMFFFRESLAVLIFGDKAYSKLIIIGAWAVFFGGSNTIIAAPTRMRNKRKIYLFTNFFSPAVAYAVAIILILKGNYLYALPFGQMLAAFLTEGIFLYYNKNWFSFRNVHKKHIYDMLKLGLPLLPSFLIYWIFNSSDRLMIASILGIEYAGIYAVGSKIGHISQLIYIAFSGGWKYFAFSTMRDRDQVELTSHVFEYLGTISLAATILVMLGTKLLFVPLFGKAYAPAAVTVPYLFLAPLMQMLFQVATNQFLVIRMTWPGSLILLIGAIGNIALNAALIPRLGIEGAAIATLAGFTISVAVGALVLQNMGLFRMPLRFLGMAGLFLLFLLGNRLMELSFFASAFFGAVVIGVYLFTYRNELRTIGYMIKGKNVQ